MPIASGQYRSTFGRSKPGRVSPTDHAEVKTLRRLVIGRNLARTPGGARARRHRRGRQGPLPCALVAFAPFVISSSRKYRRGVAEYIPKVSDARIRAHPRPPRPSPSKTMKCRPGRHSPCPRTTAHPRQTGPEVRVVRHHSDIANMAGGFGRSTHEGERKQPAQSGSADPDHRSGDVCAHRISRDTLTHPRPGVTMCVAALAHSTHRSPSVLLPQNC